MKKTTAAIVVCVLMLTVMPLAAFAHGHSGRVAVQQYSLCNVENCNTTGLHYHGDICYYGHGIGDGHDYHQICNIQGCTLTGTHEHDGVTCFGHYTGDGHSYHGYHYSGGYHH